MLLVPLIFVRKLPPLLSEYHLVARITQGIKWGFALLSFFAAIYFGWAIGSVFDSLSQEERDLMAKMQQAGEPKDELIAQQKALIPKLKQELENQVDIVFNYLSIIFVAFAILLLIDILRVYRRKELLPAYERLASIIEGNNQTTSKEPSHIRKALLSIGQGLSSHPVICGAVMIPSYISLCFLLDNFKSMAIISVKTQLSLLLANG